MDVTIGHRLRARRQSLGLSQRKMGEVLGVTFQQIQKYERGTNRIAVATLVRAAAALDAPLSFFLEGIGPDLPEPQHPTLGRQEVVFLLALGVIDDKKVRAAIRTVVRALARHDGQS